MWVYSKKYFIASLLCLQDSEVRKANKLPGLSVPQSAQEISPATTRNTKHDTFVRFGTHQPHNIYEPRQFRNSLVTLRDDFHTR